MASVPLAMRIMANSIAIANQAGKIIRDIMSQGELGIIDKVSDKENLSLINFCSLCECRLHLFSILIV